MNLETKCGFDQKDCFAFKVGRCTILSSMPKGWKCPFYKTQMRYDIEKIELEIKADKKPLK